MTRPSPQPEFTWMVHPVREHPGRATLGAVIGAALAAIAGVLMASVLWAVFALAVLVVALNRFFFPSRFEIDETGVTAQYPLAQRRLDWAEVRRFVHGPDGAFLGTRAGEVRFDRRGLHLLFGREREGRDEVVRRIRAHLAGAGDHAWAP